VLLAKEKAPAFGSQPSPDRLEELELGPSPVVLPNEHVMTKKAFRVRSPGYAWGTIEVDLERGGEFLLELDPEGALEVALFGEIVEAETFLRLDGNGSILEHRLTDTRPRPRAERAEPRALTRGTSTPPAS
jgi:hypothetical protein